MVVESMDNAILKVDAEIVTGLSANGFWLVIFQGCLLCLGKEFLQATFDVPVKKCTCWQYQVRCPGLTWLV